MFTPGAKISVQFPNLESATRSSTQVEAPTATALSEVAGGVLQALRSFRQKESSWTSLRNSRIHDIFTSSMLD
jgi:hypothetical protein